MPVTNRIMVEKLYQGEYWTNVYYADATSVSATTTALAIVAAERAILGSGILVTKYRIDDNTENTDEYVTGVVNQFGQRDFSASQLIPLFNVVRVDFEAGSGRPSRKYIRGALVESYINFNTIESAQVSYIQTNYADVLAALAGYVDIDGQALVAGVVHPFVGMRQLRRGSKKPVTP